MAEQNLMLFEEDYSKVMGKETKSSSSEKMMTTKEYSFLKLKISLLDTKMCFGQKK